MKKILTWLVFVVFSVVFISMLPSVVSAFDGGDGTPGNPFQITNCFQLQEMNNNLTASYVLMNDIDCTGTVGWNSGAGFMPIGTEAFPFTGTFDGQSHTITGLFINRPSTNNVGLFGSTGSGAIIKDVGLVGVSITGNDYVGGLVGHNYYGVITNSSATGSVSGRDKVGGLVGLSDHGAITNSYSTGSVSGSDVGGLVGLNYYGVITNSFATGSVIVGSNPVSGSSEGGLVGHSNGGAITNSFATGSVSSGNYWHTHVGGLIGYNGYGTITNSYSTGSVSGNGGTVGGLVGANGNAVITNSYSTGSVSGNGSMVGGLVGQNVDGGTITNSYWDKETSGTSTSEGGTEKTTAEMKAQSTFVNWNFFNIWAIDEGVSYPYLQWQIPPYKWTGFFKPVDNLPTFNKVKAGSAVPVKFSLNGNMGLNIFATGYPSSQNINCDSEAPIDAIEQTVTAGGSSLTYDPIADQYIYVWKTDKSWTGCRLFVVKLNDGTIHYANFKFTK